MRYHTILFDADGTLLDFERSEYDALDDVLTAVGLPTTAENHRIYSAANDEQWKLLEKGLVTRAELRTARFRNFLSRIGAEGSPEAMAELYMKALATKRYLIPEALDICRALAEHCRLYIITNGFAYVQEGRFSQSALAPYFQDVFISEKIGVEKPSPLYFEYVKAHIDDFNASQTLVVGDSLTSDIRGGIDAGLDVCWYNPKNKAKPESLPITHIVSSLSAILNLL